MTRSPAEAPGAARPSTAVDAIAERYVARLAGLSPEFAVYNGLPGRRGELDDYSPEGLAALSDLDRSTLRELDGVEAADDVDRVTVAAMRERLGVGLDLADAGEDLRSLNNIDSPVQTLRDGFDNLPTATEEDWDDFASALRAVPRALDQYARSLRLARSRGDVAARRQVGAAISQARDQAGEATSSYTALIDGAATADGAPLPPALAAELGVDLVVIGPEAPELGQLLVAAMSFGIDVGTMARGQYWAHPELAEVVENALLAAAAECEGAR